MPFPTVSAIVATKMRSQELIPLLTSLRDQTVQVDEIIVVDQNEDDRLTSVLAQYVDLPIRHLNRPDLTGVNMSRNFGWNESTCDIILFPDDDCHYPPQFIETGLKLLEKTGADLVSGRATDETGQPTNGRFAATAQWVTRNTVWNTQIEWAFFIKRKVLLDTGGFDEQIGPGAKTIWGAYEIQDLSLKALKHGYRQYYDPKLFGHHPKLRFHGVEGRRKLETYAYGMGLILVRHRYGTVKSLYWIFRPFLRYCLKALQGYKGAAKMSFSVFKGRLRGYLYARRRIPAYQ